MCLNKVCAAWPLFVERWAFGLLGFDVSAQCLLLQHLLPECLHFFCNTQSPLFAYIISVLGTEFHSSGKSRSITVQSTHTENVKIQLSLFHRVKTRSTGMNKNSTTQFTIIIGKVLLEQFLRNCRVWKCIRHTLAQSVCIKQSAYLSSSQSTDQAVSLCIKQSVYVSSGLRYQAVRLYQAACFKLSMLSSSPSV